jgi:type VII secretion-associated serine protease mycosin
LVRAATVLGVALAFIGVAPPTAFADWVRNDQWQLTSLRARSAWGQSTGAGVIVAVLDSGVDAGHADLAGQVLPGADFVDGSTDGRTDFVGHGTTVAGLIAGRNDDSTGVAGIAPDAKILPVRVLDKQNKYDDAGTVAKGLRWAVDHGASVVNMSLGGTVRSQALADAIDYAYSHGVIVVACTGNVTSDDASTMWYPAREPGVLAVSGLAQAAGTGVTFWSGALAGTDTVLSAPAVNLLGAKPGGYWRVQGTSFAAPLVAGTAALVRSKWPTMSAANVINRLISTADDLGPTGRDSRYGFGVVDPVRALTATELSQVGRNPLLPSAEASASAPALAGSTAGGPVLGGAVPDGAAGPANTADPNDPVRHRLAWSTAIGAGLVAGTVVGRLLLTRRRRSRPAP